MYICNVRLIKQNINNKKNNIMKNQVNNSQSTAAVNSAKTSFSFYSKKNDSPRTNYEIDWQDHTIAGVAREALTAYGVDAKMEVYDDGYIFDLAVKRIDGKYYVGVIVWNRDATKVLVQKCVPTMYSRMTKKAISEFATDIWEMYDYAWDMIKAAEISNKISANVEAEISEAPSLDEAPCLEDDYTIEEVCDGFYEIVFNDEDDDITDEGYSVAGLNYLRETMVDADIEDIVDEAYEEVSNDLYVWLNELFRCGECPKDEFMDTMWVYAWDIIRDRGLSDEALEAETRYYTEFDDIVERRLEEWGLYERYNKIYMERAYSKR